MGGLQVPAALLVGCTGAEHVGSFVPPQEKQEGENLLSGCSELLQSDVQTLFCQLPLARQA